MELKLGCDPELFLIDGKGNLRASCGKIGGSKRHPLPLLPLGEGYAVQEDNVALEFNIPPASSAQEFQGSVRKTLDLLAMGIQQQGLQFSDLSAAVFPLKELRDPRALEFGCDPDFNAWENGDMNPRPKAPNKRLRSCGGHVHIGYDKSRFTDSEIPFTKLLDLYLAVPSVLMDEKGAERRSLYGKPGAFRPKEYGMEYRVLSNFWVLSERRTQWVWDNVQRAASAVETQFAVDEYKDSILSAINNNDKGMAMQLVRQFDLEVA